ncbi:MAG: ribose-phosphate pyrophosphokinase [Bacteroidales bacterium]|jgi:ribose-phosphate pyrophosphokinase|nr:ribose-phosphate pyrophosphokinase [Bacteroidales bacterium]MDD2570894.1 ribose-phosphate pyrophosphokinase [Bacteroidales bacterium]MDD2812438.1 ribose-phosphate pyrophosphokinase [Bacteroidales bacterium]MDD3385288.1 ribose-phosphate pyrophosphokinase [Bacteroidales bacterium]MDD3811059.1 ribose-phosphate pyrophosphokinase [Bacteroidales bacterium]
MHPNSPIKLFSGTNSRYLAEKIAAAYGTELGKVSIQRFSDGEMQPCFEETVRGDFVFIIQSTFGPADNLLELLMMIDAASRASAYKIVAVIPYFGYARQDRKDKPRVSIAAKLMSNLLAAAGVSRIITMDLHADQIQGFFDVPVDHLFASNVFIDYISSLKLDNLVIASPDTGGTKRANSYAKFLDVPMVICHKTRKVANVIDEMTVIGEVAGKNVVLVDDIIDTAGTITRASNLIMEKGAKSIRCIATHPLLTGPAYERIENSALEEIIVTDSIPLHRTSPKIKVISISDLFADVIKKVYNNQSISTTFLL